MMDGGAAICAAAIGQGVEHESVVSDSLRARVDHRDREPEAARDELNALGAIVRALLVVGAIIGAGACIYIFATTGDAAAGVVGAVLLIPIVISGVKLNREEKRQKQLADDIKAGKMEWDERYQMWVPVSRSDPRYGHPSWLNQPDDYV